jgi:WD40 repeat protein
VTELPRPWIYHTPTPPTIEAHDHDSDVLTTGPDAYGARLAPYVSPGERLLSSTFPLSRGHRGLLTYHRSSVRAVIATGYGSIVSADDSGLIVFRSPDGTTNSFDVNSEVRALASISRIGVVAVGSGPMFLWPLDGSSGPVELEGFGGIISSIAILPGERLAGCCSDSVLRVWPLADSLPIPELVEVDGSHPQQLAALPDGRLVVGGRDGELSILYIDDLHHTEVRLRGVDRSAVVALAVLPNSQIVSAHVSGRLYIWSPDSASVPGEIGGHSGSILALSPLPDGGILGGGNAGVIWCWPPNERSQPRKLVGHSDIIRSISTVGTEGALSGGADQTIRIWDLGQDDDVLLSQLQDESQRLTGVAGSPSDGSVVLGYWNGRIDRWSQQSEVLEPLAMTGSTVVHVAALNGGLYSYIDQQLDVVIRSSSTDLHWTLGRDDCVAVAAGRDGRLIVGTNSGLLLVVDLLPQGPAIDQRSSPYEWTGAIAQLVDGRLALAGDGGSNILISSIDGDTEARLLLGHAGPVAALAALEDGRLASSSFDETIILWDVSGGRPELTLSAPGFGFSSYLTEIGSGLLLSELATGYAVWDVAVSE